MDPGDHAMRRGDDLILDLILSVSGMMMVIAKAPRKLFIKYSRTFVGNSA
jgi:hypothetical protein